MDFRSLDKENPASVFEKKLNNLSLFDNHTFDNHTFCKTREYVCKADRTVLPSYGEGIPRSLLEAMSMEKPIITTDIPGCRELVSEKNGILVKPRNVSDLYDKIKTFSELPDEEKIAMGKRGRQLVIKKYDEKIIFQNYMDLIQKTLNT
ncbi:MAG: glycosyltransferase [Candidatus Calescibacterium sp.]|nr:glycosyltransferase [Candidatus Calescibacterium sp.]